MTVTQLKTHDEFNKALEDADDKVSAFSPKILCFTVS